MNTSGGSGGRGTYYSGGGGSTMHQTDGSLDNSMFAVSSSRNEFTHSRKHDVIIQSSARDTRTQSDTRALQNGGEGSTSLHAYGMGRTPLMTSSQPPLQGRSLEIQGNINVLGFPEFGKT